VTAATTDPGLSGDNQPDRHRSALVSLVPFREAPATMIDRIAAVLDVFLGYPSLPLVEVARRAQLPPSSTHRLLQALVELGWIERDGFDYALGLRLFELGSQAVQRRGLRETALPVISRLHRQTGCTAYLSTLVDADILHLERVGLWPRGSASWDVGARQPAQLSAAGHALLAARTPDTWPSLSFAAKPTCYSVRSRTQLDREIQRTRDRGGVAVDSQGCTLGVTVIAAAVDTFAPNCQLALSLCGPTPSVSNAALIAAVRRGVAEIRAAVTRIPATRHRILPSPPAVRLI